MNQDLKNLSQWLKADNFYLNIKKTELIIFYPKNIKLDYCVKFNSVTKYLGISTAKYLGIFLDEHLLWTKQVNWVNSKLNQTTGTLSKLWYNTSLPVLKIIYHSLFRSYLEYGAQLCRQENCANRNNIQKLQNRALRKITFKTLYLHRKLKKIRHLENLLQPLNIVVITITTKREPLLKEFWTLLSIRQILGILYSFSKISLY